MLITRKTEKQKDRQVMGMRLEGTAPVWCVCDGPQARSPAREEED